MLDHISKPYDEDEVVQDEEELREEDEEILRQSSNLKLSLDIFEASHRVMENLVFDKNKPIHRPILGAAGHQFV